MNPEQFETNSTSTTSNKHLSTTQISDNHFPADTSLEWIKTGYSPTEVIVAVSILVSVILGGMASIIKAIAFLNSSK